MRLAIAALLGGLSCWGCTLPVLVPTPFSVSTVGVNPWAWEPEGAPEALEVLDHLADPPAIAAYLKANTKYTADLRAFPAPGLFLTRGGGQCGGYARLWAEALRRRGITPEIFALWAPGIAHALVVFQYPAGGPWRLVSNDYFDPDELGPPGIGRRAAIAAAAERFPDYKGAWTTALALSAAGEIWQRITISTAAGIQPGTEDLAGAAFPIRR